MTIPEGDIPELPDDLFAGLADHVVVVHTRNHYPRHRDGCIQTIIDSAPLDHSKAYDRSSRAPLKLLRRCTCRRSVPVPH